MNISKNKVVSLKDAVRKYVTSGCHMSIGGFTINRSPMAAVYEVIRQKINDIHLYAHSNGQGVDELVGAGCISRLEIAYAGSGRFAPTCIRFKKAAESGAIVVEDYSNYQMTLRFLAGAMGVPFLPSQSSLGTDIVEKWGFSAKMREKDARLPDKKLIVIDNPFGSWGNAPRLVLVPAINCDVTILHVQKADREGTARMEGLTFSDVEQAKSAKHVIVTCEELLEPDILKAAPDQNQIPSFCVDAVVHIPCGAYPTACYRYYDYDPVYLNEYSKYAGNDALYRTYLEEYVYKTKDHQGLLDKIGKDRMDKIRADQQKGYASGLDRR